MFRLFYVSTAAPDFLPEHLDALVAAAADKNRALGITGILQFNGVNFGQVLEGAEAPVRALFETIERDRRHGGVVLLSARPVADKKFDDWGMKLLPTADFAGFAAEMLD